LAAALILVVLVVVDKLDLDHLIEDVFYSDKRH